MSSKLRIYVECLALWTYWYIERCQSEKNEFKDCNRLIERKINAVESFIHMFRMLESVSNFARKYYVYLIDLKQKNWKIDSPTIFTKIKFRNSFRTHLYLTGYIIKIMRAACQFILISINGSSCKFFKMSKMIKKWGQSLEHEDICSPYLHHVHSAPFVKFRW